MPTWSPGDPWPGTPGGARSPWWGDHVTLFVRIAIEAGTTFRMGPNAADRLDAGNVLGGGVPALEFSGTEDRLWVDVTCDVLDLEVQGGATGSEAMLVSADAATLTVTFLDPTGKYDPLNPTPPFEYGGRSRLTPGVPVEVYAEVVDPDTAAITRWYLFTGTADSWGQDWTPHPSKRQAKLTATDYVKTLVRYSRPEAPAAGAGDTTGQRVHRILDYFQSTVAVEEPATSTAILAATTFAVSAWELLTRTLEDELGFIYVTPTGRLRWVNRDTWITAGPPVVVLGCDPAGHDVLTDASPSNLDTSMRNVVHAARDGGAVQTAASSASVGRFGPYEYSRTDLGLSTDVQVGAWANAVLSLYAFPAVILEAVTMRPALAPSSWDLWPLVLGVRLVTDMVRIIWAPPDRPEDVVDDLVRVVGYSHQVTRHSWETRWTLTPADVLAASGTVFRMGPHANDRLDAGNVLALT